jgi:DNA-binding response OmpR family regulator
MMSSILLVEDEPSILNLVSVNLLVRGYKVVPATNGEEALQHLNDKNLELMILDLRLPNVSGWEILDHLNDVLFTSFPVMIMTASVMDPRLLFDQYPFVMEVFIKPFDINVLISAVENVMSKN